MRATPWRDALAALRDFLRGFTGIAAAPPTPPTHVCDGHAHGAPAAPSPADVRRALAERAARRPSCC